MKLTSFTTAGRASYGTVADDGIVDLGARFPGCRRSATSSRRRRRARSTLVNAAPDVALEVVAFDPVIPNPDKIICVGLNYHDHVAETGRTVTANPVLFAATPAARSGTASRW